MRSGRYSRRKRRSRVRRALAATVAAAFLLCSGVVVQGWYKYRRNAYQRPASHPPTILAPFGPAVLWDAPRRVYPFSVIRGGAYSREELLRALESDPVTESHYQAFQRGHLRAVRSTIAKPVYVSYRKDNRIFWTSHPIRLHEGETLLTDGNSYARARCGTRISLVRQAPVAQAEPAPGVLDTVEPMEAIPEPLLRAAVEFQTTIAPVIDREVFASRAIDAPTPDELPGPVVDESFLNVLPVLAGPITFSPFPDGMPTQFPFGPNRAPVGFVEPPRFTFVPPSDDLQSVPEPAELILIPVAAGALVFWGVRCRRTRT